MDDNKLYKCLTCGKQSPDVGIFAIERGGLHCEDYQKRLLFDMKKNISLINHPYTAEEIQHFGWSPCTHCLHHRCADQCIWAYWHSGDRRYTKYRWKETYLVGEPVYSDETWIILDY